MRPVFTAEELEELRRADAEIDAEFVMTPEDMRFSRRMDRAVALDRKDNRDRKIAERNAAYRAANKDKIADYQAAYRSANKDKYRAYMRDYMRDYMRKRRAAKKKRRPPERKSGKAAWKTITTVSLTIKGGNVKYEHTRSPGDCLRFADGLPGTARRAAALRTVWL